MDSDQLANGMRNAAWLGVSRLAGDTRMFLGNENFCRAIEENNSSETAYQMVCRTAFRN